MFRLASTFIFSISILLGNITRTDRSHMIVDYAGLTIPCYVDSFSVDQAFFVPKDSIDTDSMKLKDIYFIYNDFNRVFYHSWSFLENLNRMNQRSGKIFTLDGDTISFNSIEFNNDLIKPEVFINQNNEQSKFIPMLSIRMIETDYSVMEYAIERGFKYSLSAILISNVIKMRFKWDSNRRFIPQTWDFTNDLLPKASMVGLNDTGVTYETITVGIPAFILGNMIYDYWKTKNKFYFSPIYEETEFGRNMYVFSFSNIIRTYSKITFRKIKNSKATQKVLGLFNKN